MTKTKEEVKTLVDKAVHEDWSYEQLASMIGHTETCSRNMSFAIFSNRPLECECPQKKF